MSKRAEELAHEMDLIFGMGYAMDSNLAKAAALIDAELRKERERCAEIAYQFAWGGGCYDGREADHLALRRVILEEPAAPEAPSAEEKG
jgi:hypothetical protein